MKKDLTMSAVDRQNILNNKIAIENIQEYIGVSGMFFKDEYRFKLVEKKIINTRNYFFYFCFMFINISIF